MIDELNLKIHSYKENKENASATIKIIYLKVGFGMQMK